MLASVGWLLSLGGTALTTVELPALAAAGGVAFGDNHGLTVWGVEISGNDDAGICP